LKKIHLQYNFSSEIYGLGLAYREIAKYPKWLPLFFTSDHGIILGELAVEEFWKLRVRPLWNLSWNRDVVNKVSKHLRPRTVYITHPYVLAKKLQPKESRNGTVVFPYHNVPGYSAPEIDDDRLLIQLTELNWIESPVTVCLHHHDFHSPRADFFLSRGFEVVTAGEPSNPGFLEKFVQICGTKKFAISDGWGTQVAYATYLGIPCYTLPNKILGINSETNTPEFEFDPIFQKNLLISFELFAKSPPAVNDLQKKFISTKMGLDAKHSNLKITCIAWTSLVLVGPIWFIRVGFCELLQIVLSRPRVSSRR